MADSVHKVHKRQNYLVRKGFQSRYVLYAVFFFIIAGFMVWWETYATIGYTFKEAGLYNMKVQGLLTSINKIVLLKLATGTVLVAGVAFFLSHFIAGPIHHLRKGIEAVKNGDLSIDINFRKLDELKDVEGAFNEMILSLQKRVSDQRNKLQDLSARSRKLAKKMSEDGLSGQAKELEEIDREMLDITKSFNL